MPKLFGMTKEQVKEFQAFQALPENNLKQGLFSPLKTLLRFAAAVGIARAKAKAAKEGKPFDDARAQSIVDGFFESVSEGTLWDWLLNGGIERIIALVMELLALFL